MVKLYIDYLACLLSTAVDLLLLIQKLPVVSSRAFAAILELVNVCKVLISLISYTYYCMHILMICTNYCWQSNSVVLFYTSEIHFMQYFPSLLDTLVYS